jgi:single-strand DNA-binding protein
MAAGNVWSATGNAAGDPTLRYSPAGMPIASFGLAVNHRFQKNGEWEERVSFFDVSCFGSLAENVSESVSRGQRVMVVGRMEQDNWEDKTTGEKRSKIKVVADEVGPSLRWATAEVEKNPRSENGQNGSRQGGGRSPAPAGNAPPAYDYDSEEPFIGEAYLDVHNDGPRRSKWSV